MINSSTMHNAATRPCCFMLDVIGRFNLSTMHYKFFTQKAYLHSPTYHKAFEGRWATHDQNYPYVNMTADIMFSTEEQEEKGEEWPELNISIFNKMWDDPLQDEKGNTENFSVNFYMSREEVIYLKKYLEAFLEAHQK